MKFIFSFAKRNRIPISFFVLGFALRILFFDSSKIILLADVARDLYVSSNIENGIFPIHGPHMAISYAQKTSSIIIPHLGPLYYYFLYIIEKIASSINFPQILILPYIISNLIGGYLFSKIIREIHGAKTQKVFLFVYAFSLHIIAHSRYLGHPNLLIGFHLINIFLIYKSIKTQKSIHINLSILSLFISIQFHLIYFIVSSALLYVLAKHTKFKFSILLKYILLIIISNPSLFFSKFLNNNPGSQLMNFNSILSAIHFDIEKIKQIFYISKSIFIFDMDVPYDHNYNFFESGAMSYISTLLVLFSMIGIYSYSKKIKKECEFTKERSEIFFLLIFLPLIGNVAFQVFYSGQLYSRYINYVLIPILVFGISYLISVIKPSKHIKLLMLLLFFIPNFWQTLKFYADYPHPDLITLSQTEELWGEIKVEIENKNIKNVRIDIEDKIFHEVQAGIPLKYVIYKDDWSSCSGYVSRWHGFYSSEFINISDNKKGYLELDYNHHILFSQNIDLNCKLISTKRTIWGNKYYVSYCGVEKKFIKERAPLQIDSACY